MGQSGVNNSFTPSLRQAFAWPERGLSQTAARPEDDAVLEFSQVGSGNEAAASWEQLALRECTRLAS